MTPETDAAFRCLDDESLRALLEGRLAPEAHSCAERHLATCASCEASVAKLSRAIDATEMAAGDVSSVQPTFVGAQAPARGSTLIKGDMVDHFRVEALLGRGGMGEVYAARDTKLNRRVALKVVSASVVQSPVAVARFLREARTTARLNHPNIVTIHMVGEHNGRPYLALEYVEGETLQSWIRGAPIDVPRIVRVALRIAEALQEAHRHGVLHRDLKPANVLVDRGGRVRVVDFGLAETMGGDAEPVSTRSADWPQRLSVPTGDIGPIVTGVAGTPRYMAPEQWLEEGSSAATDVWALGVMLYQLVSGGTHPFPDFETAADLAITVCAEPFRPLPDEPNVPAALHSLIGKCLAREPAERPSTTEIIETLGSIDEGFRPRFGSLADSAIAGPIRPVPSKRTSMVRWVLAAVALTGGIVLARVALRAELPTAAPAPISKEAEPPAASPVQQAPTATATPAVDSAPTATARPPAPGTNAQPVRAPAGRARTAEAPPAAPTAPERAPPPPPAPSAGGLLKQW